MHLSLVSPEEAIKPVESVKNFPVDPELIKEMERVMHENGGIGLAAPQVGVSLAIFIFDVGAGTRVICNPRITILTEKKSGYREEGCLTLPGQRHHVWRANSIRLDFQRPDGEFDWWNCQGILAQVVMHEVEHILGRLIDGSVYVPPRS